jgi:hypothetical protein
MASIPEAAVKYWRTWRSYHYLERQANGGERGSAKELEVNTSLFCKHYSVFHEHRN